MRLSVGIVSLHMDIWCMKDDSSKYPESGTSSTRSVKISFGKSLKQVLCAGSRTKT